MTHHDWLTSDNPAAMLREVTGVFPSHRAQMTPYASARKLRLFAVACCRAVWDRLTDERSRRAVEVAERFADGLATNKKLRRQWTYLDIESPHFKEWSVVYCAVGKDMIRSLAAAIESRSEAVSLAAQAAILRAIIGDPFNPVAIDPSPVGPCQRTVCRAPDSRWRHTQTGYLYCEVCARKINDYHRAELGRDLIERPRGCPWLTPDVLAIATRIYDDRDWDAMPMLADALETSGCEDVRVLEWLRETETPCKPCKGRGFWLPPTEIYTRPERAKCGACSGTGRIKPVRCRGDHVLDAILGRE